MSSTQGQLLAKLRHDAEQVIYQQRGLHSMFEEWSEVDPEFQEHEALAMDEVLKSNLLDRKYNELVALIWHKIGNGEDGATPIEKLISDFSDENYKLFNTLVDLTEKLDRAERASVPSVDQTADQVEALARVLHVAWNGDKYEWDDLGNDIQEHHRIIARAAIAHLSKRPEGLPTAEELLDRWADLSVSKDTKEQFYLDYLRPWLRDPVGCEMDVTWQEMQEWLEPDSIGRRSSPQRMLDLCRKHIRPVYECKECAGRAEAMMRPQPEISCAGCEGLKQKLHHAAVAWNAVRSHEAIDALDAALEGE